MTDHLGYEPHDPAGYNSGNSRLGRYPKTVRAEIGDIKLQVPRDRAGTFEPGVVPRGQRWLDGLDSLIINLYGKGLTTGDIAGHLFEIYGQEIDRSTISRITATQRRCIPDH